MQVLIFMDYTYCLPIVVYTGNDGNVIGGLLLNNYTLMVKATSTNDAPPQFSSGVVGPIALNEGSAVCTYVHT